MMHMWGGGFGPWGTVGLISSLLFWALIIVGIVFLVRALNRGWWSAPVPSSQPKALEILQERYARGEISTEEYDERRRTLAGNSRVERQEQS